MARVSTGEVTLGARFAGWLLLVIGVPSLIGAGVVGFRAIQQATEISAYHSARACPAGAPIDADCLQTVDGSVTAVTEFPGGYRISPVYALDVRTASAALHLSFSSDSPMLGYAVDGDPAVVTMWRGVPVSVATDGRSQVTTAVPDTALARDVTTSEQTAGVGLLFLLGAFAIRENRRAGASSLRTRPALAAAFLAVLLGGLVIMISGFVLGGRPSRLGPDLAGTGTAVTLILGLAVWAWWKAAARKRAAEVSGTRNALGDQLPAPVVPVTDPLYAPAVSPAHAQRPPHAPRTRPRPAQRARVLGSLALGWALPGLTVAVLFGLFLTTHDGPVARAYRHAPACVGETNLATCVGDFTAVINGVRTPTNGRNSADVSYATPDGAINAWVTFDGDSTALARMAEFDKDAYSRLTVRVWRRAIVGAQLGGSWHWAEGDPPGVSNPVIFLSVSFALLLLVVRLRIHRRTRSRMRSGRQLVVDDLGQLTAAAGATVLLAYGFWAGAILALAVLLWLGLSARQSTHRTLVPLAAAHAA